MIDPRACVDPGARLAPSVKVGPWTLIGPDVEIDEGTEIASHVVIKGPTRIGRDNRIFQFSTVGDATPDLSYRGEPTTLVIGNRNVIREGVTIHRGTLKDRGETAIGDDNLLMAYVHVGHDSVIGDHCILVNNSSLAGHVHVGDWAILSGYTLVHQFCHIGPHAFTGAGTFVTKDVPAYMMVTGSPAEARSINVEGLKRRGFSAEALQALRRAYKIIYRQGLGTEAALAALAPLAQQHPEVQPLIDSLANSSRGIAR